jgi:hypothetical protein
MFKNFFKTYNGNDPDDMAEYAREAERVKRWREQVEFYARVASTFLLILLLAGAGYATGLFLGAERAEARAACGAVAKE